MAVRSGGDHHAAFPGGGLLYPSGNMPCGRRGTCGHGSGGLYGGEPAGVRTPPFDATDRPGPDDQPTHPGPCGASHSHPIRLLRHGGTREWAPAPPPLLRACQVPYRARRVQVYSRRLLRDFDGKRSGDGRESILISIS